METMDQQPAEHLLENLRLTIESQLVAAKKMDIEALQVATERRQDLLFQLEMEVGLAQKSERVEELQVQIQSLDERLMAVLEIVNQACRLANPSKSATIYDAKGSISGYKV
jgi:hypothetical protein